MYCLAGVLFIINIFSSFFNFSLDFAIIGCYPTNNQLLQKTLIENEGTNR